MKNLSSFFEVNTDKALSLAKVPVKVKPLYLSDEEYKVLLEQDQLRLGELQTRLYAQNSRAVLIVLQGMDTSGKDGAIKHVMRGINPQGCHVVSFKEPTATELDHDFLWRVTCALPARGLIGIFNRSYYEEVLITRVHPDILEKQKIPNELIEAKDFWRHRFDDIVHHEKFLHRQGYEIIKIFIHISKEEQKSRLLARFQDPKKLWKIDEGDIRERQYWHQYQKAYEECIRHTSSKSCPWYIVPGDDKKNARLMISKIILNRLEHLSLEYPTLSADQTKKIKALKSLLTKE